MRIYPESVGTITWLEQMDRRYAILGLFACRVIRFPDEGWRRAAGGTGASIGFSRSPK
jgi:hypothetical protein